jgi:hypothetical protein
VSMPASPLAAWIIAKEDQGCQTSAPNEHTNDGPDTVGFPQPLGPKPKCTRLISSRQIRFRTHVLNHRRRIHSCRLTQSRLVPTSLLAKWLARTIAGSDTAVAAWFRIGIPRRGPTRC